MSNKLFNQKWISKYSRKLRTIFDPKSIAGENMKLKLGNDGKSWDEYVVGRNGLLATSCSSNTLPKLPANVYQIFKGQQGETIFLPKSLACDELVSLPDMATQIVLKDLYTFWNKTSEQKYKDLGLVYKRGVILYGEPGTGKTSSIIKLAQEIIKDDGIVIYNPDASVFSEAVKQMRSVEGEERKLLVVFEEFDRIVNDTDFLALLDGELQVDNVTYVATTNYIDKIPDRVKNRPGRFARKIEVTKPTLQDRLIYVRHKLSSLNVEDTVIAEIGEKTDGLVIDQVKDVIVSFYVFGNDINTAIEQARSTSYEAKEEDEDMDDETFNQLEEAGVL